MEHTKGPWKVYHQVFRKEISNRKIIEVQDSNGKAIIAWSGFDSANQSKKEKLANARLIAAAPELLEACQAYGDFLEYLGKHNTGWLGKMFGNEVVGKLNKALLASSSALAKAQGK